MAPVRLRLCKHPNRVGAARPLLLEDWLGLVARGKQACVNKMVQMCADLHRHGRNSRYIKKFAGPVWELKDRTHQGGARVYFFITPEREFVLVHAECKNEDAADTALLEDLAEVVEAYEAGAPVLI